MTFRLPPRPRGELLWWILGGVIAAVAVAPGAWRTPLVGGWPSVPLGLEVLAVAFTLGLWFRRQWARWIGFALLAVLASHRLVLLFEGGLEPGTVLLLSYAFVAWRLSKLDIDDGAPLRSLVLLLRTPREVDAASLAEAASRAWGIDVDCEGEDDEPIAEDAAFLAGEPPLFVCKHPDALLLIHVVPMPITERPEELAAEFSDLRLRRSYAQHRAWLSVDLASWYGAENASEAERYRPLVQLVAELYGDDVLGLAAPQRGRIVASSIETPAKLRHADPFAVFDDSLAPVIGVAPDDPEMRQAVAEARARWDEFAAAFQTRGDDNAFLVKASFAEKGESELMWVVTDAIEGDFVYGTLENVPAILQRLRRGDRVRVRIDAIEDWAFMRGDQRIGGFTVRVLGERARRGRADTA